MGRTPRAVLCYTALRELEEAQGRRGGMMWAVGWVGEIGVRVGLGVLFKDEHEEKDGAPNPRLDDDELVLPPESPEYAVTAEEVVKTCLEGVWGLGMVCVGRVLEACVSGEIVRAKYVHLLSIRPPTFGY